MTWDLINSANFWSTFDALFDGIESLFRYELMFPQPVGGISPLEIFCTLATMYMLADIAEAYFGFTGSDGDNR